MSLLSFKAGVTYGDWEGTAAADNADLHDFRSLLVAREALNPEHEFLVGVEIHIGENHAGRVAKPIVHGLIVNGNSYDNVSASLEDQDEVNVKRVSVDLTLEEILALFKRFSIVLTRRGLNLTDRGYEIEEERD